MSLIYTALWIVLLGVRVRRVTAVPRRRRLRRRDHDDSSSSDSDSDSDCDRACRRRRGGHRLSKGAIAGIVIGIVVFLILFFIILWLLRRRQKQKKLQRKSVFGSEGQCTDILSTGPPAVPPKDTRVRRNMSVPASLIPSSPTGGNQSFVSMRNLGNLQSQRSADHPSLSVPQEAMIRSNSERRSGSPIEPIGLLPNPYDLPSDVAPSSSASVIPRNSVTASSFLSGSSTRRASALHEDMVLYQKKLEVHDHEEAQVARQIHADPPPSYGA